MLKDSDMEKKTAFIGHRNVPLSTVKERLRDAVEKQIAEGCFSFIMGTHGAFDEGALSVCREARRRYPDLKIEIVLTSYHQVATKKEHKAPYSDDITILFDTEDIHYKKRILLGNHRMIDECDTLICYVDEKRKHSGAKTIMLYARRKGLRIINLYQETDDPTFGMTNAQKAEFWEKHFVSLKSNKNSTKKNQLYIRAN